MSFAGVILLNTLRVPSNVFRVFSSPLRVDSKQDP